jgi:hypothetical protein
MLLYLITLTYLAPIALVLGQRTSSNDCSAFSTDGLAASHFQYYRLYDFRNISEIGTQRNIRRQRGDDAATNITAADETWVNDWYVRDHPRASPGGTAIPVNFVPWRVEIGKSGHILLKVTQSSIPHRPS